MQNKIITAAVVAALTTPVASFAADKAKNDGMPTLYGKVHLSYGATETKDSGTTTVDEWTFRSHASRVGVKGKRDISDNLAVTYKFEWEVNLDGDNKSTVDVSDAQDGSVEVSGDGTSGFSRRNMYVGLKGDWGELRFGRHDTPLKMAQGKFDLFGDTDADLKHAGDEDGENRLDNILAYIGSTNGFQYQVAFAPGEGDTNNDNGPADTISAAFGYSKGPLHVMIAHDSYANDAAAQSEDSLTRLVGTYKVGGMQFGAFAQSGVEAPDSASAKEDWLGLSFSAKVGANGKIKAQYITVEDNRAQALESTLYAIGYDHSLDKKTKLYAIYTKLDEDDTSGSTDDLEKSFLGAGIVYKF